MPSTVISELIHYDFIKEHYNFSLEEWEEIFKQNKTLVDVRTINDKMIEETFDVFRSSGIIDIFDFFKTLGTRDQIWEFSEKSGISYKLLESFVIQLRAYLPVGYKLGQVTDHSLPFYEKNYLKSLQKARIRTSLDLLEVSRTEQGRKELSAKTGIPELILWYFINYCDILRLPHVTKTQAIHFWNLGYSDLQKIAEADLETFSDQIETYYKEELKKRPPPRYESYGRVYNARFLPKILE